MTKEKLMEKTDKAIQELVYDKVELQKAYNYYNGIRDKELFRYLEEVYGANTPTTLHFTPLIKKHIDALIGEYLGAPIIPKIFCKDGETIANIDREKLLRLTQELLEFLKSRILNDVLTIINGQEVNDSLIEKQIKAIKEDVDNNFVSEYEIAAQNVVEYIIQSRDVDLLTVLRDLILDLLITGDTYYKVLPSSGNNNVRIKALSPLNTFVDLNIESPYAKNSERAVVRHWYTQDQILNLYGKEMTVKDRQLLKEKWQSVYDTSMYYVRLRNKEGMPITDGIDAGREVTPGYPSDTMSLHTEYVPVYEVEWIETDKDFVQLRYETIRIGEEIYILRGKNDKVIRSKSNPSQCTLSVNGVHFLNRHNRPYSMVLACAHLLDLNDLLVYYRDSLIANSGTIGDWIDLTLIPEQLGASMPERLQKWLALKKQGLGILDSSQEGRLAAGASPLNTIFNGYDDTVKVLAIQAIQLAIDSVELTVSSITGVFRERLNGIELRDAVTNILQGVANSFIITKQYYHQMDLLVNEILLDCLNLAKIVWKDGLEGTIILGDKYLRIFTALPKYFTITDHDIRIITSTDILKDLESIKLIIPEFVKSGGLPPDIIMEAITCKSIPDLKAKVKKALKILKEENDLIAQLTQLSEELQKQLQLAQQELQKAQLKIQQLNEAKLQIDREDMENKYKIEQMKAETDRNYKVTMAEEAKKRTEVELRQMVDGNPYNDKIVDL